MWDVMSVITVDNIVYGMFLIIFVLLIFTVFKLLKELRLVRQSGNDYENDARERADKETLMARELSKPAYEERKELLKEYMDHFSCEYNKLMSKMDIQIKELVKLVHVLEGQIQKIEINPRNKKR